MMAAFRIYAYVFITILRRVYMHFRRLIKRCELLRLNRLQFMTHCSLLVMLCHDMVLVHPSETRSRGPFPQSLFLTRYDTPQATTLSAPP